MRFYLFLLVEPPSKPYKVLAYVTAIEQTLKLTKFKVNAHVLVHEVVKDVAFLCFSINAEELQLHFPADFPPNHDKTVRKM